MQRFVTLASFNYVHESQIMRAILENNGIICFIRNEHTMYMQPFFDTSGKGIRLEVAAEDEEDARRVLINSGYLNSD
jgi:hypothetical protein